LFYVPSLADFSAAFGPPPASEPPPGVSDSEPPTTAFELQAVSEPPTASIELQTDSEPPTAAVPPLLAPRMCAFCNKLGPLHKKCGRCLRTRYCDRQCQLRHWQEHMCRRTVVWMRLTSLSRWTHFGALPLPVVGETHRICI
jgi:hypothetical protein